MPYKILVVCTGNICRSPTGEAVLKHIIAKDAEVKDLIKVESCGISGFHVGELPDARSVTTGEARGISFQGQSARKIQPEDFYEFDLILAMDKGHLSSLQHSSPRDKNAEIALFLEFAGIEDEEEVGDPYYGGNDGFTHVFDLIMKASEKIIDSISSDLKQGQ